ncbi:MAG TPA: DEAD/DEAH box helicase [Acholeplasma sp.]|nr:DEAD/DEAH box helicase [Acholeplasma sp.]
MFNIEIEAKVKALGFKDYTEIQKAVFNAYGKYNHIIGLAPTGTGKTHAYLLPILNQIDKDLKVVQAVICVPTNDLVIQVEKMIKEMSLDIDVKSYYQGKDRNKEILSLKRKQPQIVVATPGKLNDYVVKENALKIYTTKVFVLDEADMMFDMDFLTTLDPVFETVTNKKVMIFSATLPVELNKWVNKYFGNAHLIDLKDPSKLSIEHGLIQVQEETRNQVLMSLLKSINPYLCIIFVSKNENMETVYQLLNDNDYSVVMISSKVPLRIRKQLFDDIRNLKYQYIVSSDLSARGLDIDDVSHIINYDLPYDLDFYIHRSGRTGRMGKTGLVYSLVTLQQNRKVDALKKKNITFTKYQIKNNELVKTVKKSKSGVSAEEMFEIRKIKKPTKVKPNYKKKNKESVKKAKNSVRYGGKK